MELKTKPEVLMDALSAVTRVIPAKCETEAMENALLTLKGERLQITCCNSELSLTKCVEVPAGNDGTIAVNGKLLFNTVKMLPDGDISFKDDEDQKMLCIKWASGESRLPLSDVRDFPVMQGVNKEKKKRFSMKAEMLKTGLDNTSYAAATDELRPVMTGTLLDIKESTVIFVASDARILICDESGLNDKSDSVQLIVPQQSSALLTSLLDGVEGNAVVDYDGNLAAFFASNFRLTTRLIAGKYPAYRSVIPQNSPSAFTIARKELIGTVRRMMVFSNTEGGIVIEFSEQGTTASSQDCAKNKQAKEKLSGSYSGEPVKMGFKAPSLLSVLLKLKCEEIRIEIKDASHAALISDAKSEIKTLAVIMPTQIK